MSEYDLKKSPTNDISKEAENMEAIILGYIMSWSWL